MTRMFRTITATWNPICGCFFGCTYCWARGLAETRLKHLPRYRDGFKPKLIEAELSRRFKPGEFVFICSMGDIAWAEQEWVERILERIVKFPETKFLFQSKDPRQYSDWHLDFPPNLYLGTTIETNRDYQLSKAPSPSERYLAMTFSETIFRHPHRFIGIEPIMDFDLEVLVRWVENINPEIVEVGADNYGNNLPEPPWGKVEELLSRLRLICPRVEEKDGLSRLKNNL